VSVSAEAGARPGAAALRAGSRIDCHGEGPGLAERLRLSCGTCPVAEAAGQAAPYRDDAIVPRGPWRRPSAADLALLRMDEREWRRGADVAIVRVPDDAFLPFAELWDRQDLHGGADPDMMDSLIANDPLWSKRYAAIRDHLAVFCAEPPPQHALLRGLLRTAEPNRSTLTTGDDRKLEGLHVDSWDGLPFRHRARSRNRISVNLGREPRYSLFVNLTLMDMFRHLGLRDPEDIYADFRALSLGSRFLRGCPEYPVVRLRVDPGEAYILPTDNMLHDASTEGTTHPDVTLTYVGHFTPGRSY
jgi:hypothetical protein